MKENDHKKSDSQEHTNDLSHLQKEHQDKSLRVFRSHEDLFEGALGAWPDVKVDVELQLDAKPCQAKPFQVPHTCVDMLKKEVEELVEIGVLEPVTHGGETEWQAPAFIVPKKDGKIRFLTNFC